MFQDGLQIPLSDPESAFARNFEQHLFWSERYIFLRKAPL